MTKTTAKRITQKSVLNVLSGLLSILTEKIWDDEWWEINAYKLEAIETVEGEIYSNWKELQKRGYVYSDLAQLETENAHLRARVAELEAQVAKYETPCRYTFHDLPELYERHATLTNVLKQLEEERDDTTP